MSKNIVLKIPLPPIPTSYQIGTYMKEVKEFAEAYAEKEGIRIFDLIYEPSITKARAKVEERFEAVFKKMIDQYYTYRTKRYYRHGTGRGTGTGVNLYRSYFGAFDDNNKFTFVISPRDMEDYVQIKGVQQPADSILDYVINGGRSMPPFIHLGAGYISEGMKKGGSSIYPTSWAPDFTDEFFGKISGKPITALKSAMKRIPKLLKDGFWEEANNYLGNMKVRWV